MVGVDVVPVVQWLQSLGKVTLNFQYLFMVFSSDGKKNDLRGIQGKPSKVIISNSMKKLIKKQYHGVIGQLFSLNVQSSISFDPLDLQIVINNHSKVFGEITNSIPLDRYHDHVIHLQLGSAPPNIIPYKHPYA
jgi:hypothetical protein